jgi:hypothetical protein
VDRRLGDRQGQDGSVETNCYSLVFQFVAESFYRLHRPCPNNNNNNSGDEHYDNDDDDDDDDDCNNSDGTPRVAYFIQV